MELHIHLQKLNKVGTYENSLVLNICELEHKGQWTKMQTTIWLVGNYIQLEFDNNSSLKHVQAKNHW